MTEHKDKSDLQEDLETVEQDTFTDAELEDLEENSAQKIKTLKEKLKTCEKEKMEHLEDLQRAKAEFLNAKKRIEEEKVADRERAVVSHIEKLLPLSDSFFMAMSNKAAWESIDPVWRKGVESIAAQLSSVLQSYGVKEVNPQGEQFDPNKHEALTNIPTEEENHDKVISVIQTGFVRTHGDKEVIIRPARVTVGEYKA